MMFRGPRNHSGAPGAETAKPTLNALTELIGKPIRIMWAKTDSTLRKSVISNIIIQDFLRLQGNPVEQSGV